MVISEKAGNLFSLIGKNLDMCTYSRIKLEIRDSQNGMQTRKLAGMGAPQN